MTAVQKKMVAKPFVKWAGGKGQLLKDLRALYPQRLWEGGIQTFVEPFVGGGAVLLDVLQTCDVKQAVIVDSNRQLVNGYRCVQQAVESLILLLDSMQAEYLSKTEDLRKEAYLQIRKQYNQRLQQNLDEHGVDILQAAQFIFLNKTCFNGLYRVNRKGEYNVPFGKYTNPKICDADNLRAVSALLQKVEIVCGEYAVCRSWVDDHTFVYFDPPYRPISQTAYFVGYQKDGFDDDAQKRLAGFVQECVGKGADILLSNSDPKGKNEQDNFFDDLYGDFDIARVTAKRAINSNASKRGNVSEIVVKNYTVQPRGLFG